MVAEKARDSHLMWIAGDRFRDKVQGFRSRSKVTETIPEVLKEHRFGFKGYICGTLPYICVYIDNICMH